MLQVMLSILYYTCSALFLMYMVLDITWRIWKRKLSFLPSAPNVPWLGTTPYLSSDPQKHYQLRTSFHAKYDHLYVEWFGPTPQIRIGCVEYVEALLGGQEINKPEFYGVIADMLGEGLFASLGTKWKKRRTALTRAFHFASLDVFIEIYEKHGKNLVNKLQTLATKGNAIEVQQLFKLVTLDVICESSMGVEVNALDTPDSYYARAIRDVKTVILKRLTNPFLRTNTLYQYTTAAKEWYKLKTTICNFTTNVINEGIASRQNQSGSASVDDGEANQSYRSSKKVFIDVILDLYEKGEIDVDGIRDEVHGILFAGHETTATALSWTLYEIGRHPEIQEKLRDEIDSVSSKDCSLKDKIRLLKYTECVIKESLRFYPPATGYSRVLEKDMIINGNVIPSGTIMAVDALSIHMNPAYWDQPTVFNPGRFEIEESLKRNPYCFVPFSAGPRNCLGQKFAMLELKVFVYSMLSNFTVKSTQTRDEVKPGIELSLYSVNGINIEFCSRN